MKIPPFPEKKRENQFLNKEELLSRGNQFELILKFVIQNKIMFPEFKEFLK